MCIARADDKTILDTGLTRLLPLARRSPSGYAVHPAACRHAVFSMLDKKIGNPEIQNSASSIQHRLLNRRGFTLLEIMLAVMILALMSLAIYRFVQSNIIALRVSSDANAADARYDALRDLLIMQLQSLPPGAGALAGEPLKLSERSRDEIKWTCSAGPGLLTRYAAGDFTVSMRLQPESKKSDRLDLGFLRKPKDDVSFTNVHESWVPLVENVRSLRIRYFDPRINVWLDKWTDTVTLPRLVKVVVERNDSAIPWEAIIPLGRTPL